MWDYNDKNHYDNLTNHNVGQICNDSFFSEIEKYASNPDYKTFLEVGTWNGLGSTKAFANGFSKRNDDYIFYSLECNTDKCNDASKLYRNHKQIHILNEVIWNKEPDDFFDIFPQCKFDPTYKHWHDVDMVNMETCKLFLDRSDIPATFDVILLDGGEFTTYHEFQILKRKCNILMLDDTECDKCKFIVQEIVADPRWKIIKQDKIRNGYVIAERIF
jgi:hypothetical protein